MLELIRNNKSFKPEEDKKLYLLCHSNQNIELIKEAAHGGPFTVLESGKDFLYAPGGLALASSYLITALKYNVKNFVAVSVSQQIFFSEWATTVNV